MSKRSISNSSLFAISLLAFSWILFPLGAYAITAKPMHIEDKIPIKMLIDIPPEELGRIYNHEVQNIHNRSFGMSYTEQTPGLPIPIGQILKDATLAVFAEIIQGPLLPPGEEKIGIDAIIRPSIEDYSYSYVSEYVKTSSFPMPPSGYYRYKAEGSARIRVAVLDRSGNEIWSDSAKASLNWQEDNKEDGQIVTGDVTENGIDAEPIVKSLEEIAGRLYKSRKMKNYIASIGKQPHGEGSYAPVQRQAAIAPPIPDSEKAPLVLMPLRSVGLDRKFYPPLESAIVEGLSEKHIVFAGSRVAEKVEEIYRKVSEETPGEQECDQTKCLQNVAIEFQTELVAVVNIIQSGSGYFLSINIINVLEDKMIISRSEPCEGCTEFQLIGILKKMTRY